MQHPERMQAFTDTLLTEVDEPMIFKVNVQLEEGSFYSGQLKDSLPHAVGTEITKDGDKYTGEWRMVRNTAEAH